MTGGNMRNLFAAILFAGTFATYGVANAANECGPGCHSTANGACAVDGWETGTVRWNECPAGARPRPPCGRDYVWRPRLQACFQK
jgi:hypothetical protein